MTADQAAQYQLVAAAVQAVGSILGIAVAIWVPFRLWTQQSQRQEAAAIYAARTHAILIYPSFSKILGEISGRKQALLELERNGAHGFTHLHEISIRPFKEEIFRGSGQLDIKTLDLLQTFIMQAERYNRWVATQRNVGPKQNHHSDLRRSLILLGKGSEALERRYQALTTVPENGGRSNNQCVSTTTATPT